MSFFCKLDAQALDRLAAGGNSGIFPEGQLSPLEAYGMGLAAPRTGADGWR